jgi:hypothetical protein
MEKKRDEGKRPMNKKSRKFGKKKKNYKIEGSVDD